MTALLVFGRRYRGGLYLPGRINPSELVKLCMVVFAAGTLSDGRVTMRRLLELSDRYLSISDLTPKTFHRKDGASKLASILFEEATSVLFYIGQSVNKAHQGLEIDTTMKLKLVEHLAANLRAMGKTVTLYYD